MVTDDELKQATSDLVASGKWTPQQGEEALSKLFSQQKGYFGRADLAKDYADWYAANQSKVSKYTEKQVERDRLYWTQSDYVHCDYVDSSGHKCGALTPNFVRGIQHKSGVVNSIMLCNKHMYLNPRKLTMEMAIILSFAIGLMSLGVCVLLSASPFIALIVLGVTLMAFSTYGKSQG